MFSCGTKWTNPTTGHPASNLPLPEVTLTLFESIGTSFKSSRFIVLTVVVKCYFLFCTQWVNKCYCLFWGQTRLCQQFSICHYAMGSYDRALSLCHGTPHGTPHGTVTMPWGALGHDRPSTAWQQDHSASCRQQQVAQWGGQRCNVQKLRSVKSIPACPDSLTIFWTLVVGLRTWKWRQWHHHMAYFSSFSFTSGFQQHHGSEFGILLNTFFHLGMLRILLCCKEQQLQGTI